MVTLYYYKQIIFELYLFMLVQCIVCFDITRNYNIINNEWSIIFFFFIHILLLYVNICTKIEIIPKIILIKLCSTNMYPLSNITYFFSREGEKREPSVKTLCSPRSTQFSRECVINVETQYRVLSTRARKLIKLIPPNRYRTHNCCSYS